MVTVFDLCRYHFSLFLLIALLLDGGILVFHLPWLVLVRWATNLRFISHMKSRFSISLTRHICDWPLRNKPLQAQMIKWQGMKLIDISRKTRNEKRYTRQMGMFYTKVTYIKKRILGIPVKTLHKYRNTYYGEVKDCGQCILAYWPRLNLALRNYPPQIMSGHFDCEGILNNKPHPYSHW